MIIAIDARDIVRRDIGRVSGVNQYTSYIIQSMVDLSDKDRFLLFVDPDTSERDLYNLTANQRHVEIIKDQDVLSSVPFVGNHLILPNQIHDREGDVFFSPTGLLPLGLRVPSVGFIHDLLILQNKEWFPDSALQQLFTLRLVLPRSIKKTRTIVVPSHNTMNSIIQHFPSAKKKIQVVPEGIVHKNPDDYAFKQIHRVQFQIREKYIVSIGTVEPRKNLLSAIKAYDALLTAEPSFARTLQYVIAGSRGWGSDDILKEIQNVNERWRQYNSEGVIRYLGLITEQEKWELYTNAELYLFTSFAEGFGLPPFEAMSVGTPVITTKVGGVAEYVGDSVLYIKPDDVQGIALQIKRLLQSKDLREQYGAQGYQAVRKLTWARAAEKTLDILHNVGKLDQDVI